MDDETRELEALRRELHKLNTEYRNVVLARDASRQDSMRAYYTNRMEQLDERIEYLAQRISLLV